MKRFDLQTGVIAVLCALTAALVTALRHLQCLAMAVVETANRERQRAVFRNPYRVFAGADDEGCFAVSRRRRRLFRHAARIMIPDRAPPANGFDRIHDPPLRRLRSRRSCAFAGN